MIIKRTATIKLEELLPHALILTGNAKDAEGAEQFLKRYSVEAFVDTTPGVDSVAVTLLSATEKPSP